MANFAILDANDVALTEYDSGYTDPGAEKEIQFQYQNTAGKTLTGIKHFPFPGKLNNTFVNNTNFPLLAAEIIRETEAGSKQTSTIAKEDVGAACAAFEQRVKCYEYISGSYTERTTGAVNFMAGASDEVILLCDRKILNIYVNLATLGSYTGFDVQIWTGAAWTTPASLVDGTSGLTQDGVIQIDKTSAADWAKKQITGTGITNPVWGYPVKFKCSAVTTQAVSEAAGLYWEYAYTLPKCCLYGTGDYYLKDGSTYVPISPDYEYANLGMVVFQTNPFAGAYAGYSLCCAITYKNPQPGVYVIDADSSSTVTVTIDGGSPSASIGVSTAADNENTNVISGVDIEFNTLTTGDQGTITISDALKYIDWSLDDTTYYNNDLDLVDMNTSDKQTIYGIYSPPMAATESSNEWDVEIFVEGT
jgi:hypothetical protein